MSDRNDNAASQHEKFLRECREIDAAYLDGSLDQWVKGKVDEYRASHPAPDAGAGEQVG